MKIETILGWIDKALDVGAFDDVSNNGLQLARGGEEVTTVAFAVDASVKSVREAVKAGAQLLVVHHGISWGGGIKRLTGGIYNVVAEAMKHDLAIAGYHLPLDANRRYGNNYEIAREMKLKKLRPKFSYHGNVIGVVGENERGELIGICSGGAGAFAEDAKRIGCVKFITGEADWGEVIAAENVGMEMECRGHYETETYGVSALARGLKKAFKQLKVVNLTHGRGGKLTENMV